MSTVHTLRCSLQYTSVCVSNTWFLTLLRYFMCCFFIVQLVQPYYVNNNVTMQFLRAYFTDKNVYLWLKKDHDLLVYYASKFVTSDRFRLAVSSCSCLYAKLGQSGFGYIFIFTLNVTCFQLLKTLLHDVLYCTSSKDGPIIIHFLLVRT